MCFNQFENLYEIIAVHVVFWKHHALDAVLSTNGNDYVYFVLSDLILVDEAVLAWSCVSPRLLGPPSE